MAFKFTFSIQNDLGVKTSLPGVLVENILVSEIAQSGITVALAGVSRLGDVLVVQFKAELPESQEDTLLKTIIPNHNRAGKPPGGVDTDGAFLVVIDGPRDPEDKKPVVVVSPATEGFGTWLVGAGDDLNPTAPDTGRGGGERFRLDFTSAEVGQDGKTKVGEYRFREPIELHDGEVQWTPLSAWGPDDDFSFGVRCPPTVAKPNANNEGNCNIVATGRGFNLIVPAPGDGSHDVDLAAAVPVKAVGDTNLPNGYWDVVYNTGEVRASSAPGGARWNLIDVEARAWLIRRVAMTHRGGWFSMDAYKTEYLHHNWAFVWEVTKRTVGDGTVTGWLLAFRRHTT